MGRRRGLLPYELARAAQKRGGEGDVSLGPAWVNAVSVTPRPGRRLGWLAAVWLAGSAALLAFAIGRRAAERPQTDDAPELNDLEQVRRTTPLGYEQLMVDRGALSPGRSASLEKSKP